MHASIMLGRIKARRALAGALHAGGGTLLTRLVPWRVSTSCEYDAASLSAYRGWHVAFARRFAMQNYAFQVKAPHR